MANRCSRSRTSPQVQPRKPLAAGAAALGRGCRLPPFAPGAARRGSRGSSLEPPPLPFAAGATGRRWSRHRCPSPLEPRVAAGAARLRVAAGAARPAPFATGAAPPPATPRGVTCSVEGGIRSLCSSPLPAWSALTAPRTPTSTNGSMATGRWLGASLRRDLQARRATRRRPGACPRRISGGSAPVNVVRFNLDICREYLELI